MNTTPRRIRTGARARFRARHAAVHAVVTAGLVLGAAVVLSCGGPTQARRYFTLAPPAPQSIRATEPPTLRVRELDCATAYDQEAVVFRVSAVELRSYRYLTWSAPPGIMVSEVLRRYMAASGRFVVVEPTDPAELELTGRLDVIEQSLQDGDWAGRLEMSLALRRVSDGRVFWRGRIDGLHPAESEDVAEVVAAQSRVLGAGLEAAMPALVQAAVDAVVGPPAGASE
jgi:ABC-type uncharacterized transport system auxiliary subunit